MTLNDYKEKPRQKAFCVKFNAGCSESNLRLKFVSISPFFFSFATNLLHSPAFQHSQMFLKATKITFTFNYFHFQPKYCFAICWMEGVLEGVLHNTGSLKKLTMLINILNLPSKSCFQFNFYFHFSVQSWPCFTQACLAVGFLKGEGMLG